MSQTIKRSWCESWSNIFIGWIINFLANMIVFPLFGYELSIKKNILLGTVYTGISLLRSFCIRRWFNKND